MTVYAERVFALNAVLNFLLLLGSARLAGTPAPMRRVLPAAAVVLFITMTVLLLKVIRGGKRKK